MPPARPRSTLSLPREIAEFLTSYAMAHGMTPTEVVLRLLEQLREHEDDAMDLTDRTAAEARALFNELAQEWQNATRFLSSLTDITSHPAYQRIIGMGKAAVPLVLERLRRNPDHWFWALKSITGVDPVNDEARGDLNAMSRAWLDWGRQHGYS